MTAEFMGWIASGLLIVSGVALCYWLVKYSAKAEPEFWEPTATSAFPKYETTECKITVVESKPEEPKKGAPESEEKKEDPKTESQAQEAQPPELTDPEQAAVIDQMLADLEEVESLKRKLVKKPRKAKKTSKSSKKTKKSPSKKN